jgi:NitT/TauT family transport system permease protein
VVPPGQTEPQIRGARPNRLTRMRRAIGRTALRRGIVGLVAFVALWEVATRLDDWINLSVPYVGKLPPASDVLIGFSELLGSGGYWDSWYLSFGRVIWGFVGAMIVGIPFGLLMATNRTAKRVFFPPFEVLRPIPPLAWVPLAIIFWPTQELSITFVTFLGAFYTVVMNTVGGAEQIDRRYLLAARSMGANRRVLFRRVILPATLPRGEAWDSSSGTPTRAARSRTWWWA